MMPWSLLACLLRPVCQPARPPPSSAARDEVIIRRLRVRGADIFDGFRLGESARRRLIIEDSRLPDTPETGL